MSTPCMEHFFYAGIKGRKYNVMDTVCKEFRDHHRHYTGPGEYCTIEFIWFQLKKYDPLVFKTIKIIKVLFETSKFCILVFWMSLFSMQNDKELSKTKIREEKKFFPCNRKWHKKFQCSFQDGNGPL